MIGVSIDKDTIKQVLKEVVREAVEESLNEVIEKANALPPILDQKQLMGLLGISRTKASELINRKDFPVCREMGNPRIVTADLFKWLTENSNNELYLKSKSMERIKGMRRAGKGGE